MDEPLRFRELPQGDDRTLFLTAVDSDGDPVDLTGAALRVVLTKDGKVTLTSRTGEPDAVVALGATPAAGQYVVVLSDDVTAKLAPGQHLVEVKARLTSGQSLTLLAGGVLPVVASAIRDDV
jgi:hypothetical protein